MWKQVGLWRLAFIVFPVTAVTVDPNFAIFGVPNLLFGMPVGSILPPWDHFVSFQLGDTLGDHMGAARRTHGSPKQDFY